MKPTSAYIRLIAAGFLVIIPSLTVAFTFVNLTGDTLTIRAANSSSLTYTNKFDLPPTGTAAGTTGTPTCSLSREINDNDSIDLLSPTIQTFDIPSKTHTAIFYRNPASDSSVIHMYSY